MNVIGYFFFYRLLNKNALYALTKAKQTTAEPPVSNQSVLTSSFSMPARMTPAKTNFAMSTKNLLT